MDTSERPKVFMAIRLPDAARSRVEAECAIANFDGQGIPSKDELISGIRDVEGLLGSAQLPVDADVLAAARSLRVVSNFGVGFDNVDVVEASKRGILVCNTPGVLSDAVADLTIGLMLSLARHLPESERFLREGIWKPGVSMDLGIDVSGKTLGIIGLGRIGIAVAKRAHAFGMAISFHDQFREVPSDAPYCRYRALDDLLGEADFVSLHLNLLPETRALMGVEQFALMKRSAFLINTSRGKTVDQTALVEALREERIAGAALDVLEREPPEANEPILSLPNVILLPHIGSATVETRQAMRDLSIDNLLLALRGERPKEIVNPEVLDQP